MGGLSCISNFSIKRKASAPGKSIVVATEAAGNQERNTEYYQLPGFAGGPTPGDVPVEVRVGTGSRIVVASQNYKVEVDVSAGETLIYSTSSDGDEIQAQIKLDSSGNIMLTSGDSGSLSLNGESKSLVTYTALNTALQTMLATINTLLASKLDGTGIAGTAVLDISGAATTTVKTGG